MATCTRPQCSSLIDDVPKVGPNPDISGLGVLVGFTSTAYMTLILVIIHYLFDCGPQPSINPIDRGIIDFIWRIIGRRPSKKWGVALRRGILMFSDQQVVTGIAVLSAGYSQLHCGLSSYHWEIVVYLAWFSSVTHLTTLTVLYQYFRHNPRIRNWRAAFMLATVTLLAVALLPTGNIAWGLTPGVPAQCFFDALAVGRSNEQYHIPVGWSSDRYHTIEAIDTSAASMAMSLVVLSVSFFTRIIKLSEKSSVFTRRWIRSKPGNLLKRRLRELNRRERVSGAGINRWFVHDIYLGAYVMLKAIFDINESMLWEIIWLIYALIWGTIHLYTARDHIHGSDNDTMSEEDSWGFGQWVPVLLLMLPLLAMGETFYELSKDSASKYIEPSDPQSTAQSVSPHITNSPQVDPVQTTVHGPALVPGPANGVTCIAIPPVSRTGRELDSVTENAVLDNPSRTDSMISPSGHTIGTANVAPSAFESTTTQTETTSYDRDFYQYAWFRLLIVFILVIFALLAVFAIGLAPNVPSAVRSLSSGLPLIIFPVPIYSFLFVWLDGYRSPNPKFLQMLRRATSLPYFALVSLLVPMASLIYGNWNLFPPLE